VDKIKIKFTFEVKLFLFFIILNFVDMAFNLQLKVYYFLVPIILIYILRNIGFSKKLGTFFFIYLLYILVLAFLGALNGNYYIYLYYDLIAFSSIFFALIILKFNLKYFYQYYLPRFGVYINAIAIVFTLYYISKYGFTVASIEEGRGLNDVREGQLMSPKAFLGVSLLIYPLVSYIIKSKFAWFYHISIFLHIFFSLAMASRGTTIVGIIVFVLTYMHIKKIKLNFHLFVNLKFYLYIVGILLVSVIFYQIPAIASATDYLLFRFTTESLGKGRTLEATTILNSLTTNELMFGKGLGASNTYWIFKHVKNGVNNAHYGWIFLILKGGVIFVVFIYGKILFSIFRLFKISKFAPYAICLIAFLMLEYAHTNFNNFLQLSWLFTLLFASNIAYEEKKNSSITY